VPALPDLPPSAWVLAALAAFCTGLSKAGFGGFGLITVLLMAMVLPAKESTGAVLPMLIAADLMAVGGFRRHVDRRELVKLLPPTLAGLAAGWLLMDRIPDTLFGSFLGWTILAMMALVLWQRFDKRVLSGVLHHPVLSTFSGVMAGITTMTANAGGPVMTFYLLAKRFDKMAFVGTCAWFFFITNLVKVPLSWSLGLISYRSLILDLMLIPVVGAGMLLGRFLLNKIPQAPFEWLLLIMATASALKLIFT